MKDHLFTLIVCLAILPFAFGLSQDIPDHEVIEYSMIVTYIGPRASITYDTEFIQETMREASIIYCEGEFEFETLIDNDKKIEIVCIWDGMPDGVASH